LQEGFDAAYSDEDKFNEANSHLGERFFKPDWSPEYFRGAMYVGHLLCVRRELARRVRFDPAFEGAHDFDFMLRLSETGARVGHVARPLYHARKDAGSSRMPLRTKPELMTLEPKVLNAHLTRLGLPARAEAGPTPHRLRIVPAEPKSLPKISIIIPTRDSADLLSSCLAGIFERTGYPNFEVILADNNTTESRALEVMHAYPLLRVDIPDPFNFSRANNLAARQASGEYLVFLNNDTEIISRQWLDHLLYYAEQKDVGAAGALLLHENNTIQHAGIVLGVRATADHAMRGFSPKSDGYFGSLSCAREVSAVTAACIAMRKSLFLEMGGFNEQFSTIYQDLDLCLRLRNKGLRIIWTPHAVLLHHESISRQKYYDLADRELLLGQWKELIKRGDPYYNRNFSLERADYTVNGDSNAPET
jgi:GT2 family glycosyltransferase